jgi:glyoxylase-like metal-dependent hydrolase (beta-lactamase superfamily II)
VRAALAALGIAPADLATVVVTHMHLDHAVEAVRSKTLSRYAAFADDADPAVTEKFDRISGAAANAGGIWHWLDKLEQPAG